MNIDLVSKGSRLDLHSFHDVYSSAKCNFWDGWRRVWIINLRSTSTEVTYWTNWAYGSQKWPAFRFKTHPKPEVGSDWGHETMATRDTCAYTHTSLAKFEMIVFPFCRPLADMMAVWPSTAIRSLNTFDVIRASMRVAWLSLMKFTFISNFVSAIFVIYVWKLTLNTTSFSQTSTSSWCIKNWGRLLRIWSLTAGIGRLVAALFHTTDRKVTNVGS